MKIPKQANPIDRRTNSIRQRQLQNNSSVVAAVFLNDQGFALSTTGSSNRAQYLEGTTLYDNCGPVSIRTCRDLAPTSTVPVLQCEARVPCDTRQSLVG